MVADAAWQDMLATVRHNLQGAQHIARIRLRRSFRIRCIDRSRNAVVPPNADDAAFDAVIGHLLRSAPNVWVAEQGSFDATPVPTTRSAWLALTRRACPPVIECDAQSLDWPAIAARTFDPYYVGGGEKEAGFEQARQHAKRRTARRAVVAFIPMRDQELEVVASANVVDAWYRVAVMRAVLTSRLWPPGARPGRA
jgi:hypothetical protein